MSGTTQYGSANLTMTSANPGKIASLDVLMKFVVPLLLMALAPAADRGQPPLIPLVFVHGEDEATTRKVIGEVAEGGNTGFVWESRPHPDYLGPKWWSGLGIAIDEAKKRGLEVWIFDEWMYPSGIAGGKVVAENSEFAVHVIEDRSVVVSGPSSGHAFAMPGKPGRIVSVSAFRKGSEPLDLTARGQQFAWDVPAGEWRIVWVVERMLAPKPGWVMDNMIDVMNPQAVQTFIRLTHEATYRHFGPEFGKTIKGFFSDEAGFRNITSYDSLPGHPGMPMPWSPAYAGFFERLKGYDPRPKLASLWYDTGASGRKTRYDLMDAYSRAFAENFFKPQQSWCHAHNVRLIGHLVEDNHADHQLGYGPGHWFRAMQYFDMPGIDVVGYQVTPGLDAGPYRWTQSGPDWDQEHFSFALPAMARGSAWMKHDTHIFSESFGAYGWAEGLRMLKWIGDWLIVNGINVVSPHAVSMKYHDTDCPPHYNSSAGNPQGRYYGAWSEPFKRLQKLTVESEPVYDAAVLYTGESAWVGAAQNVAPVVRAMETAQISTVVLPYDADWSGFRTVVLPFAQYVPAGVLDRLAALNARVLVLEAWPQDTPAKLRQRASLVTLPELAKHIEPSVRLDPPTGSVVISRRRTPNGDWILLHNRSLRDTYRGHLNARVSRYDAASNRWFEAPEVELPPYTLWTLWTGAAPAPVEPAVRYRHFEEITGAWQASAGMQSPPGDWRGWPNMAEFSGTVRYTRTIAIGDPRGLALDLGEVGEIAELRVNGSLAGVRIAPPYRWDLTGLARAGENTIEVDVTNTAQARWKDEFSHGDAVSGLLGPVWLLRTDSPVNRNPAN